MTGLDSIISQIAGDGQKDGEFLQHSAGPLCNGLHLKYPKKRNLYTPTPSPAAG